MRVRFQADADLNFLIVRAVRRSQPGIDFRSASDANLAGLSDTQVLENALQQGRVLVTHDHRTMPRHFADFIRTSTSAGVLIVPKRMPPADVVEALVLIGEATEAGESINRICYLPL